MKASVTKDGESKGFSTADILAKPVEPLTVPMRPIEVPGEAIVLGFTQSMIEIGEGSVSSGAGLGTDFIQLRWGDKEALVRGSELLRAWVATFAPEEAERFPDEVKTLP